jgi:NAD(P)-dependent dehydrogenase (short-subunit alcohol dehydrogenase family)
MIDLSGRIAVVTGGGNGIGRETARTLARLGAHVGIVDLDGDAARSAAEEIAELGVETAYASGDVAESSDCRNAVETLASVLGTPDVLVNNAGISPLGAVRDISTAGLARAMAINVGGALNMTQAVAGGMAAAGGGRIVNVASWLGTRSKPNFGLYSATKAALISLTRTSSLELAPDGIAVNAVLPGAIGGTPMRTEADAVARAANLSTAAERAHTIPLGRLGTPGDVAAAIAFLCSDAAAYITGDCLLVDGGLATAVV